MDHSLKLLKLVALRGIRFTVTTICSFTAHNTSKWRKYHKCAWKKSQILIYFILTLNKTIFKTQLNGDKMDSQCMHIEKVQN